MSKVKVKKRTISVIDDIGVEEMLMRNFDRAMKRSISMSKKHNLPIAKYDVKSKRAYLEYPDGRIVYDDEA